MPLSVEAVVKAYQREAKAIAGRNEDGERWIAQLQEAYTQAADARRGRAAPGARVNIVDCYFELVLLRQPRASAARRARAPCRL